MSHDKIKILYVPFTSVNFVPGSAIGWKKTCLHPGLHLPMTI